MKLPKDMWGIIKEFQLDWKSSHKRRTIELFKHPALNNGETMWCLRVLNTDDAPVHVQQEGWSFWKTSFDNFPGLGSRRLSTRSNLFDCSPGRKISPGIPYTTAADRYLFKRVTGVEWNNGIVTIETTLIPAAGLARWLCL
jgi:hypothetical protein